ncbi:CPBP family intramembrane glutamic endopeptidase [Spirosoma gilvum]
MKPSFTLTWPRTILLFGGPTLLLYVILAFAIPTLRYSYGVHPALSWFIGGSVVFKTLLLLALGLSWQQIKPISWTALRTALCLHPLSSRDWRYSLIGLATVFAGIGLIMGACRVLHQYAGTPLPDMAPPALSFPPFQGAERWLLLVWAIMFFFNIVGEECLWRGFILQRQLEQNRRWAWLVNGAFWAMFHLPFGWSMVLMALPAFLVVPYVFQQTRNTTTGIVIHGLMNGPLFIVISLGLIEPGNF